MLFDNLKNKTEKEFYSLTGVKMQTFEKMVKILTLEAKNKKYRGGKPNKLSIEDRILMTLEYWKQYTPYSNLAHKYQINRSNCMRNIIWVENMLIEHPDFHIPGKEEFIKIIQIFLLLMLQKVQLKELKKTEKVLF